MVTEIFFQMRKHNMTDWGVVFWGCEGLPIGQLPVQSMNDYAADKLNGLRIDDRAFTLIAELALSNEISIEIKEKLQEICEINHIDLACSKKKWLVFALKEFISDLPADSLYGILEINAFWSDWGELKDSPNMIQGVENDLSPNDFYTEENYKKIVTEHKHWISQQLLFFEGKNE